MKPNHYKLGNIKQSSLDSVKETSPSYSSSCSGATVYNYSTPSPENSTSFNHSSPGTESSSSSVHYQHQTFSDIQASLQHSPQYGGNHSPYDRYSYGNCSPYSNESCNGGAGIVLTPPHQSQVNMNAFAIEATMYMSPPSQSYITPMETSAVQNGTNQDFRYPPTQCIKQEPFTYDAHYCGYHSPPLMQPMADVHQKMPPKNNSYVSQAKARYSSVAVAGKQFQQNVKKPTQEDAAIMGISQWLQQGSSTPVH